MVAPLLMGVILYSVTRNVLSIVFIGLSPILMLGNYLDQKVQARRKLKAQREQFEAAVVAMRDTIDRTHAVERAVRLSEAPSVADTVDAVRRLGGLLWTHRPEHDAFLSVRIGLGSAPARTQLEQPSENNTLPEFWNELEAAHAVRHDLRRPRRRAAADRRRARRRGGGAAVDAVARGVLVQLAGLHSPSELVLAAVTSQRSRADWEWLEWLRTPGRLTARSAATTSPTTRGRAVAPVPARGPRRAARRRPRHARRAARAHRPRGGEDTPKPVLPTVVVLVEDDAPVDRSRLTRLVERGADAGVHVVWVAPSVEQLPAACRTFVLVDSADTADTAGPGHRRRDERRGPRRPPDVPRGVRDGRPRDGARGRAHPGPRGRRRRARRRRLGPPRSVSYLALAGTALAEDPSRLIDAWRENGSLTPRDGSPPVRRSVPTNLRGLVGHSGTEPLYLDLRTQGPHALVGGTTGAGKSEFLQSWVLGMAAAHSPDRVTFLFVDYKGGAAFADCVNLPHTVGLVTDLSPHLVRRALTSLRAELRYREHLLNRKKAKDLASLERTGDPDAPPSLLIVVDEFAALVNEVPEFVDGVVDVAQRGRSLGLHLILATQRPAGVIRTTCAPTRTCASRCAWPTRMTRRTSSASPWPRTSTRRSRAAAR